MKRIFPVVVAIFLLMIIRSAILPSSKPYIYNKPDWNELLKKKRDVVLRHFKLSDSGIIELKAVEFICTKYQNEQLNPPVINNCDSFRISLKLDSFLLVVNSPNKQSFKLTPIFGSWISGDSIESIKYNSVNQKDEKCVITVTFFRLPTAQYRGLLHFEYTDKIYMYYVID